MRGNAFIAGRWKWRKCKVAWFLSVCFECINRAPRGSAFPKGVQSVGLLSENLYAESSGSVKNSFWSAAVAVVFGDCQYTSNDPTDEKTQKSKLF